MSRKTKRFMVGFDEDRQAIYGKDDGAEMRWAFPLTWPQAERKVRELSGGKKTIYKLVPVRGKKA